MSARCCAAPPASPPARSRSARCASIPAPARVTVDGNPVKLTSLEYRLLSYLAHHKGKVVSRTELVEHLYDQDFDRDSNTIEVFVGRLRKKLDTDLIQTVRGLGYCLDEKPSDSR
ncbi:MAG: winged helix-turn-helix domain-containing protein [Rhizomicrobium sp.]